MRPQLVPRLAALVLAIPLALHAQQPARFASLQEAMRTGGALAGGTGPRDVNWIDGGRRYSFIARTDSGAEEIRVFDPATLTDSLLFRAAGLTFSGTTEPFAYESFQWAHDSKHLVFQTRFKQLYRRSGTSDYYVYSLADRGLTIAACYTENESGAKLARPELFRLLADSQPGDILLVEQDDRLSRLTAADWERLKAELTTRRVRVVALDLPTSWTMATNASDEFTGRMFEAITACCSTCSPPWRARTMTTVAVANRKASPRRWPTAATAVAQRIRRAMAGLLTCSPPASRGGLYRPPRAAAVPPSRRSPSGPLVTPDATLR